MAGRSRGISWYEWSDRHVEKESVMSYFQRLRMKANPEAKEEVAIETSSFKGSILSRVLGRKRREKEERKWREEVERKRAKKNLEEHKLALEEHFCRSYVF